MRLLLASVLLVLTSFFNSYSTQKLTEIVVFASLERSKLLLAQEDVYTDRWSAMDIDIRMQKANSTKQELMNYIPTQARAWNENEKELLYQILSDYNRVIESQAYHLNFPDTIFFIKTTMDEELRGASAYTRANAVIFNGEKITSTDAQLPHLVVHELFHILSRHDPELRRAMYQIIGFELMDEVKLTSRLASTKLSNPDAPFNDSYIRLVNHGEAMECMMLLYANKEYNGGGLLDYLNVGLVKLTGTDQKQIDLQGGEPVILQINQVPNFFDQVGKNTNYIINPEEIMADNFAFTLNGKNDLPNPEIIDEIKKYLRQQ
jgi:hypothetical protein